MDLCREQLAICSRFQQRLAIVTFLAIYSDYSIYIASYLALIVIVINTVNSERILYTQNTDKY